jgi:Uma2 family endonuclease
MNIYKPPTNRVETATGRHRIPDVMALDLPFTPGRVVVDAPAIVVEIKSPDDTFDDIVGRCFDYEAMGIGAILVMDPDNSRAWRFKHGNLQLLGESTGVLSLGGHEI